jgi:hypothetical protein
MLFVKSGSLDVAYGCYNQFDFVDLWHGIGLMQEAKTYAQENGLFFMETSAKSAINVNDIFYEIGELSTVQAVHQLKISCTGGSLSCSTI